MHMHKLTNTCTNLCSNIIYDHYFAIINNQEKLTKYIAY